MVCFDGFNEIMSQDLQNQGIVSHNDSTILCPPVSIIITTIKEGVIATGEARRNHTLPLT